MEREWYLCKSKTGCVSYKKYTRAEYEHMRDCGEYTLVREEYGRKYYKNNMKMLEDHLNGGPYRSPLTYFVRK